MTHAATLERTRTRAAELQSGSAVAQDDATMLKAAALLGYGALFATMFVRSTPLALLAGLVAVLALYRAGSFIHELTHIKKGAVKGFRFTWNLIVGVPLMVPSFMYEGVHNQHHAKTYYGTANDPEYLPLALMKPWTLPVFMIAAAAAGFTGAPQQQPLALAHEQQRRHHPPRRYQ